MSRRVQGPLLVAVAELVAYSRERIATVRGMGYRLTTP